MAEPEPAASDAAAAVPEPAAAPQATEPAEELVTFRVVFAKETHQIEFDLNKTIAELKKHLEKVLNCPAVSQKLMYKGSLGDTDTLRSKKIKKNAKVLLVGATAAQIVQIATDATTKPDADGGGAAGGAAKSREKWMEMAIHKKVLDKGKPADAEFAYRPPPGEGDPMPQNQAITLFNGKGKVRVNVKLSEGMVVVSTNERTQKLPLGSIQGCQSQPIPVENQSYHILGLQLGPTEKSMLYLYWFPAQYVRWMVNYFGR